MLSNTKIIQQVLKENSIFFKHMISDIKFDAKYNNFKKYKTIVIIGMGGSILGAKAIYSFLKHKIKKKLIFLDNLDEDNLKQIKKNKNLSKSLFLIISKSGNTNETILNMYFLKNFLKNKNTIILSENRDNFLRKIAIKNKYFFVNHNKFIGGRYSVLSNVGMLPAYFMNLQIEHLKRNLRKLINNKKFLSKSLNLIKKLKLNKTNILIFFNYIPELNDFLFWVQQLFAESLGKNRKGFIPVISNAPKDHHSLLQLYLDGPKDKIFYVFSSEKKLSIKAKSNFFGKEMQHLNRKKYNTIINSQKNAFLAALKSKKIPFREINIKKFDEDTLGKLFSSFIIETVLLGKIMNINPFDQPAVEQVKILTKKFLKLKKF
mgnify:CR=1 FL=1